jgi:hypothetical protein
MYTNTLSRNYFFPDKKTVFSMENWHPPTRPKGKTCQKFRTAFQIHLKTKEINWLIGTNPM